MLKIFLITIVVVFIIAFYVAIKIYKKFECPKCGHKQNKSKEISIEKYNYLDHGKKTITGKLDKRYNNTFSTNKIIHYQVECEACGHSYEYTYDKMEEMIDNDPIIKKLNKEIGDINDAAIPSIRKMKKQDPTFFKKLQKIGMIPKDFK